MKAYPRRERKRVLNLGVTMSATRLLSLSVAASMALVPYVRAQDSKGQVDRSALIIGFAITGIDSPDGLLLRSEVQKELQLSDAQIKKIEDLQNELHAKAKALPKNETKGRHENNAQGAKAARDLLKPAQVARLHQIQMQTVGPSGFFDEDVANKLKLTPDQKKQIRVANNEGRKEIHLDSIKADPATVVAKWKAFEATSLSRIIAVLTADQAREYNAMVGKPFAHVRPILGPILRLEAFKD